MLACQRAITTSEWQSHKNIPLTSITSDVSSCITHFVSFYTLRVLYEKHNRWSHILSKACAHTHGNNGSGVFKHVSLKMAKKFF